MLTLPTSGTLTATKTHKSRSWTFVAGPDATQPYAGTLTVCQGKRPATYLVGVSDDGKEVMLAKQDAAADVYAVRLVSGKPVGCCCPGWRFAGHCLHADAVRALVEDGSLDVTPNPAPGSGW